MDSRSGLDRWALVAGAVLFSVGVGFFAYNAGAAHALAGSAVPVVQAVPGAVAVYGFYHPWGFGPVFPLFFLVFWFVALRALIGRRRWWGRPRGYYGDGADGVPPMFEEWHRGAHARETQPPDRN